ncbi:hypothetical protein Tco_0072420 [Tanacetum coccineum]
MGESSRVDDEGFIEVKRKKSSGNIGGTKHFKPVSITSNMTAATSRNGTFLISNSFEALNFDNLVSEDVDSGNKASLSDVQKEGKSSTPLVEKINKFKQQMLDGKCVLVDDEGNPLEMVDYFGDHDSEDEVLLVDNKMASFMASKPSGVGYGTNSFLEQWRDTYENADYDHDPYDDDMYEGREIPDNIQSVCDNLDIKDEIESFDNDMARSMASERVGFGTQSLLEQWMDSYENCDYDEDLYDDDMYEGQDLPDKIQEICDNLDIRVQGRRKK